MLEGMFGCLFTGAISYQVCCCFALVPGQTFTIWEDKLRQRGAMVAIGGDSQILVLWWNKSRIRIGQLEEFIDEKHISDLLWHMEACC